MLDRMRHVRLVPLDKETLYKDFDLMVSALEEAHTGLYWYITGLSRSANYQAISIPFQII